MLFSENFRIALRGLAANKLRAALTMLGIMIGVSAVITLLAIGDGVTRFVAEQFSGLGTNLVFILPGQDSFGPPGSEELAPSTLTLRDAELLSDPALVPGAQAVAPTVFHSAVLQYQGNSHDLLIRASTPAYASALNFTVDRGEFFSDAQVDGRDRVVVLGPDTAESLFPRDIDPLGASIKIDGLSFRVTGILARKGAGSFGGNLDDIAIIPITTGQERLFNNRSPVGGHFLLDAILIQGVDEAAFDGLIIDISNALRVAHNINFRDADDFQILTQQDFLEAFGDISGILTLFLGAIAGISLLVGGIGIMNIMLVSVTERTREIGLRKAVGAKYRDILGQFLTEAVLLALLGGLLGIILGLLGAMAVRLAVPQLETAVSWTAIALSVGFSAAVGLFFGIYPASRAAALHPIDALRFE